MRYRWANRLTSPATDNLIRPKSGILAFGRTTVLSLNARATYLCRYGFTKSIA
jgi:hypothetical protein